MDLLGLESFPANGAVPAPAAKPQPPPAPSLSLAASPQLTPADFQRLWGVLQPLPALQVPLTGQALAAIEAEHHQVRLCRIPRHFSGCQGSFQPAIAICCCKALWCCVTL